MLRYLFLGAALGLFAGCGGDTKLSSPENPVDTPTNVDAGETDGGTTEEKVEL